MWYKRVKRQDVKREGPSKIVPFGSRTQSLERYRYAYRYVYNRSSHLWWLDSWNLSNKVFVHSSTMYENYSNFFGRAGGVDFSEVKSTLFKLFQTWKHCCVNYGKTQLGLNVFMFIFWRLNPKFALKKQFWENLANCIIAINSSHIQGNTRNL